MKKKLLSVLLTGALAASMFVGCGTSTETADTGSTDSSTSESTTVASNGTKVGVAMPTKDLQRWNQDGANMQSELEAEGYEVDLQYASNDTQMQISQIENMISSGCDVLVVAAIEASSLGEAMDMAAEAGIPVIAYDRLIMNTDAVSYYATFDNYKVGTVQGEYIEEALDLANTTETYTMEITAGDPGDNNAGFFYQGAMDVLQQYIDNGTLVVKSSCSRFSRTLSTLIAAGMNLVDSLNITAKAVGNVLYQDEIESFAVSVQQGIPLSQLLKRSDLFPPMITHMAGIGEETGDVEEMLTNAANYYDEEVETTTAQAMALIEPLIIIVMALMVVLLIGSIYTPMMSLYDNIQ